MGDEWGEIDTRFSYCAVAALALLGRLDVLDKDLTVSWIKKCKNFDGSFGRVEGAESHASYGWSTCARHQTTVADRGLQCGRRWEHYQYWVGWTSLTRTCLPGG